MKKHYRDWKKLSETGTKIVGVEVCGCDRSLLFRQYAQWAAEKSLTLYLWNEGYDSLQTVCCDRDRLTIQPDTQMPHSGDGILNYILSTGREGIFLVEGIVGHSIDSKRVFQLQNVFDQLSISELNCHIALLSDAIEMPPSLYPLIPVLVKPFPDVEELEAILAAWLDNHPHLLPEETRFRSLIFSCAGMSEGEINICLERFAAECYSIEQLSERVLEYKTGKLAGRGVKILGKPDISRPAGLELLDIDLDKISELFDSKAKKWNLEPPKGGLLWGLPGTGKSLIAKTIASRLKAAIIAVDFNQLLGATASESVTNLKQVLHLADTSGNCVLFCDEFEKYFAGWDSGSNGGLMAKMTGELLTWLQDHTSPVFFLATINRLNLLPAEMVRRFDYIWFVGLPHDGALFDIFNVHLPKYFPNYYFTDDEWRIILDEYRGCTPDEVGKAVKRVAQEIYYRECRRARAKGEIFKPDLKPPFIKLQDLIEERDRFTPASANQIISDQLYAIQRDADFARPTSVKDTSKFARPDRQIFFTSFESGETSNKKNSTEVYLKRNPPLVEAV